MKSRTIKSLFEKLSNVKLGPLGKRDLPLPPPPPLRDAIDDCQPSGSCITSRPAISRESRYSW